MKSTKIFIITIVAFFAIFLVFVNTYFNSLNSKNVPGEKSITINGNMALSDKMIIDAIGGDKKIERNIDGKVLVRNIGSSLGTKTKGDVIDTETTSGSEVMAQGDLNGDGFEDAILENTTCGASCGITLMAIINQKDGTAKIQDISNQKEYIVGSSAYMTDINSILIEKGIVSIRASGFLDEPKWVGFVAKNFKFENEKLNQINSSSKNWNLENIETGENSKWKILANYEEGFNLQIPVEAANVQLNSDNYGNFDESALFQSPDYKTVIVGGGEETYPVVEKGYSINVITRKNSPSKTIKDLQDFNKLGRGGPAYENEKVIKVSGKDAITYTFNQPNGGNGYVLWALMNDGTLLEIIVGFKGVNGDTIFKRIISSLYFENIVQNSNSTSTTSASPTNTDNWKTYTSSKYGFTIKYPEGTDINDIGYDGQNSSVLSFSLKSASSSVTSRMLYFITETKSWYDAGTSNMSLKAPANCSTGFNTATTSININGTDFSKSNFTDAATAQRANISDYCVLKNGIAYKLEPMLVYSRDYSETKNFNPSLVNTDNDMILNQMVSTFRFLK